MLYGLKYFLFILNFSVGFIEFQMSEIYLNISVIILVYFICLNDGQWNVFDAKYVLHWSSVHEVTRILSDHILIDCDMLVKWLLVFVSSQQFAAKEGL